MNDSDVRWQQRLANYNKALAQLARFIAKGELNELEVQGLIQSFEYTHELAWNLMKDYLQNEGFTNLYGSKSASKQAFKAGLISDGDGWAKMMDDRNKSVHTYNEDTANEIAAAIRQTHFPLFLGFQQKMQSIQAAL